MKSNATYRNPLAPEHGPEWEVIEGSGGNPIQRTVTEDPETCDYTRPTRFRDGYATESFGTKSHD